jgi:DNA polymerase
MNRARRAQYLKALGVTRWRDRRLVSKADKEATTPSEDSSVIEADRTTACSTTFDELALEAAKCTRCALHKTRNRVVFGSGNVKASWFFVGEAPGREEDRLGEAFVGRSGQLLNSMLFALGLDREDAYIANVLKCRPPDNRDPAGEEVATCESFLHRQVELVQPSMIMALGRFAAQSLLKTTESIGQLRGQLHSYEPFRIPLIVTYHPAYLLRSPLAKRKVWLDLVLAQRSLV